MPTENTLLDSDGRVFDTSSFQYKGITFERDGAGRIKKMTDPAGAFLTYEYDLDGNLRAMVDREGNRTPYEYNDQHQLVDIFDPLGKRAIHNVYDPVDGRLVQNVDADGKAILYTHDLACPSARAQVLAAAITA